MGELTKEDLKDLVSEKIADYSDDIYMFVPRSDDQPVIMYRHIKKGVQLKHYLSLEVKLKYPVGMHSYRPREKPSDINDHQWSDDDLKVISDKNDELWLEVVGYNSAILKSQDAIAIARHFQLTAEDLK